MIPAQPGIAATFRLPHPEDKTRTYESDVTVHAFDGDGYALILDHEAGRLVRAADKAGFLELGAGELPTVAAVPGSGWMAVIRIDDDELEGVSRQRTVSIVAWTFDGAGFPTAHIVETLGNFHQVSPLENRQVVRFIPPGIVSSYGPIRVAVPENDDFDVEPLGLNNDEPDRFPNPARATPRPDQRTQEIKDLADRLRDPEV